jgi:hypothetical protein
MKGKVFTRLRHIIFSVGMDGEGDLEGHIYIDVHTDVTLPELSDNLYNALKQETCSISNLPDSIKKDLRKVFRNIQKLVEGEANINDTKTNKP